jgi:PKD repeat protein
MTVDVGLAVTNPSALAGLVSALYVPGTSEYRSFRTPSELAGSFGPSPSAISNARAYFERFGLSVTESPDRLLLFVTGSNSEVGAAFGTTFEQYRSSDGHWFFSHSTPATLPTIAPWSGVYGLGNVSPLVPTTGAASLVRTGTNPAATCIGAGGPLTPCQIWQAYNMTSLVSAGTNGSGFRLAVVDAYSSAENQVDLENDLAQFAAGNGFAVGTVNYVYPVPAPGSLNASSNLQWNAEDALDLQWARASAPGATIDMTLSPNAGPGLYEAVDWLVSHQAANVISMSWGEPDVGVFNPFSVPCSVACNASTDGSYGILSPVLAFAAAEGISVFAASGDCGAADGTVGVSTHFPASDPDVTGVGGTVLSVNSSGSYLSEVAWSGNASGRTSPGCTNQGGSGGGYSPFPRPIWQSGLPSGVANRGVPDVALDAASAVEIVLNGAVVGVGGTSASTPIWAGIAAIADQNAHQSLGLLNPSLYAIASGSGYARDFHDVVSGNNGYSAGPGWDPVTGLGSPRVATLVVDLAHPVAVSSSDLTTFVYATPRFGEAPLPVTFRLNATGGSGTYPLEGVLFGDGNASFAAGGTATHTFSTPGVYSAQSYVADSLANYSVSPPVVIVVGGGSALSVTLSVSTNVPATGASVLFSATVAGGVAPYEYNFSFGDGTYLSGSSTSSTSHAFGAHGSFCAAVVVSDSAAPVNGGASARVALGVGGAPVRDCQNDTVPVTISPAPNFGVRDAPADFPALFSASGGSTAASGLPPSLQFSSTDPYLAACGCTIFRAPGTYRVTGYANDSENEQASIMTNVTVAPPLVGSFTATPTFGPAPLTVDFLASVAGGYGADAATTEWTFGDGTGAIGASVSATYATAGEYVALAQLSDRGHGNASEAFLIDVGPTGGSSSVAPPFLTATIDPAVDVPLGSAVNLTAALFSATGSSVPASFLWSIGPGSGGYRSSLDWTYSVPLPVGAAGTLNVTVNATDLAAPLPSGPRVVAATFHLPNFGATEAGGFRPRTDDLALSDTGGPASGTASLLWAGTGVVTGPGSLSVLWAFGDGGTAPGFAAHHLFFPGQYTVEVTATDGWGDLAVDVHPVAVFGALGLTATLSTISGSAPLAVEFRSTVTGGLGPPYLFLWSFGDDSNATVENGSHTFGAAGTYRVSLNVSDSDHDSAQMNWTVAVTAAPSTLPAAVFLGVGAAVGVGAALAAVRSRRRSSGGAASP